MTSSMRLELSLSWITLRGLLIPTYTGTPLVWSTSEKVAKVILVPKPGKPKQEVSSYRPISLLPVIGKVFERCIYRHLADFLRAKDILRNHQFGFRAGHSTTHQLFLPGCATQRRVLCLSGYVCSFSAARNIGVVSVRASLQ